MSKPSQRLAASHREFAKTRLLVLERDGGRCFVCGAPATQVHHRLPRGLGGSSRNAEVHSPANLISICHRDHEKIENARSWAYGEGLLVHRWESCSTTPVRFRGASWYVLTDDGRIMVVGHPDITEAGCFVE